MEPPRPRHGSSSQEASRRRLPERAPAQDVRRCGGAPGFDPPRNAARRRRRRVRRSRGRLDGDRPRRRRDDHRGRDGTARPGWPAGGRPAPRRPLARPRRRPSPRTQGSRGWRPTGSSSPTDGAIGYDALLVAVGSEPASDLLGGADGIPTDACGRTRTKACTHAATWPASTAAAAEHWTSASGQAAAVASAILGNPEEYTGTPYFWSDQFGLRLQMIGTTTGWSHVELDGDANSFRARYVDPDGKPVAVLLGNRSAEVAAGTTRARERGIGCAHAVAQSAPRGLARRCRRRCRDRAQLHAAAADTGLTRPRGKLSPRAVFSGRPESDHVPVQTTTTKDDGSSHGGATPRTATATATTSGRERGGRSCPGTREADGAGPGVRADDGAESLDELDLRLRARLPPGR